MEITTEFQSLYIACINNTIPIYGMYIMNFLHSRSLILFPVCMVWFGVIQ